MYRKIVLLLTATMLLAAMSGCRKPDTASAEESQKLEITQTEDAVDETEAPAAGTEEEQPAEAGYTDPLTGEETERDISAARPYAVMVNNISVAQPQVGVSGADIIYELMDEGGITRMMAFFTDMEAVEKVGSIRSVRLYNVSVAESYDAILVHAGGSTEGLDYISSASIESVDYVTGKYTGDTFYRDPDRQTYGIEHSLFATGSLVVRSAEALNYRLEHSGDYDASCGLTFSRTAAEQCTAQAACVRITYAGGKTTEFRYDADAGLYTAYQYDGVYTDNGQTEMAFANVLVINADTSLQSDGVHLTIELTGSGDGYFCCGGEYVPIRWYRADTGDSFHYTTADGQPLSLSIGKTFVAVQQTGSYTGTTEFFADY